MASEIDLAQKDMEPLDEPHIRQTSAPVGSSVYDELIYGSGERKTYTVTGNEEPVYLDVHTNIKRELALQEIIDTERTYIKNVLRVLHEGFFVKLMSHQDHFSSDSIKVIFSNIIEIHQVHTEWLESLEEVCKKKTGKGKKQARLVSGVFSDFSVKLRRYEEFCGLAPSGIDLVAKLMKSKKVCTILEECKQSSGQRFTLKDLLPVIPQRIQKYPMLLHALHKSTPDGHPDKVALLATMENMTVLTKYINDVKVEKDRVREYQARLRDYKGESLVLLGKLFFEVDCGLVTSPGKIECVSIMMFQKGLLVCKYNWKELKGKQKGSEHLSADQQREILSQSKLSFEHFFELIRISAVTQLTPAGMPDLASIQTNLLDVESYTSGWSVETSVRGGNSETYTFVATRANRKLFTDKFNRLSGGGVRPISQVFKINKQSYNFPRTAVKQGNILGKGNFGAVYKGTLSGQVAIAIKTFNDNIESNSQFYQEIETLASITKSMNEHLLQFYGIVPPESDEDGQQLPLLMLTEYLDLGSLQSYLRTFSRHRNQKPLRVLANYAEQVADGMAHLESIGFVHRDLAARNVLVGSGSGEGEICKIADFGLSRVLNNDGRYLAESHTQLPYKWTAPEGLVEDSPMFTTKSDVWSFGVLMIELFTYGVTPYKDLRDPLKLLDALDQGLRLQSPRGLPVPFYSKILECWKLDPSMRPSFSELSDWLVGFWEINDERKLCQIGYSPAFCRQALAERSGSLQDTANFLFAILNTEFEMKQASVQAQGNSAHLKMAKVNWDMPEFPEPNTLVINVIKKRDDVGGGDTPTTARRSTRTQSVSPSRTRTSSPLNTPTQSPSASRRHFPSSPSASRRETLGVPSPRTQRAMSTAARSRMAELFGTPSSSKPERDKSMSTQITSPPKRLDMFNTNEYPGFEDDSDEDGSVDHVVTWQCSNGTGGWNSFPPKTSEMIEHFYNANRGEVEYSEGSYWYKVDFGSMMHYRVDKPSVNQAVRRVNGLVGERNLTAN